jgi:hypothetical protein
LRTFKADFVPNKFSARMGVKAPLQVGFGRFSQGLSMKSIAISRSMIQSCLKKPRDRQAREMERFFRQLGHEDHPMDVRLEKGFDQVYFLRWGVFQVKYKI